MARKSVQKCWSPTGVQFLIKHASGTYYARGYRDEKQVWHSLGTTQISVAKARLSVWLQEHRKYTAVNGAVSEGRMTMADALQLHLTALTENVGIKESTRHYWRQVSSALFKSWPGLAATDVRRVSATDCRSWSARFAKTASASRYNNTVAILRHVFEQAIRSGCLFCNPAQDLQRRRVRPKDLSLPSRGEFSLFVQSIRTAGAWCSQACADLVEFLAYAGCRRGEAALVCWRDVNFCRGELVVRGDPVVGTKNGDIRRVPLIPDARGLLERVRESNPSVQPEDKILRVRECQRAMDRAAEMVKITRITHHDLRHLFATVNCNFEQFLHGILLMLEEDSLPRRTKKQKESAAGGDHETFRPRSRMQRHSLGTLRPGRSRRFVGIRPAQRHQYRRELKELRRKIIADRAAS